MTWRNQVLGSVVVLVGMAIGLLAWAYLPKYMLAILPALGYLLILFIVRVFRLNLKMDENWTIRKAEEPSDQVVEGKR